ncbi:hypothetical protein AQZ50_07475 [Novosphingobium sp. Fuku2-ISO-50]|nr:hypothetical protein AQZ50_07475 [Novosphingobium sp. Fuku2-ISO-50]
MRKAFRRAPALPPEPWPEEAAMTSLRERIETAVVDDPENGVFHLGRPGARTGGRYAPAFMCVGVG